MNKIREGIYCDPISMDLAIVEKQVIGTGFPSGHTYYTFEGGTDNGNGGEARWRYTIPEDYTQDRLTKQGWHFVVKV